MNNFSQVKLILLDTDILMDKLMILNLLLYMLIYEYLHKKRIGSSNKINLIISKTSFIRKYLINIE